MEYVFAVIILVALVAAVVLRPLVLGVGTGAGPRGGGSLVERNLTRWTLFFSGIFVLTVIVLLKN